MVLRSSVQDSSATTVKQRILSRDPRFAQIYEKTVAITQQEYSKMFKTLPSEDLTAIFHIFGMNDSAKHHPKNLQNSDLEVIAKTASYLILNKIFSYSMLRAQLRAQYGVSIPVLSSSQKKSPVHTQLTEHFLMMVTDFEFAPIFRADPLFPALLFTPVLAECLQKFIDHLEEMEFAQIQHDFIASFYELLLPGKNKKLLGEIYTPPDLADLMVKLAVQKEDDVVLDPTCGCGNLLRASYEYQKSLITAKKSKSSFSTTSPDVHHQLLSQIWGVEINPFPAQLAMLSLAMADLSSFTNMVGILMEDFLDLGPLRNYSVKTKNLTTGQTISRDMPKKFDVIVANPPYIKQEKIPRKKAMMKNLPKYASYRLPKSQQESSDLLPPTVKLDLTGKTDYYGFFVWYSTYFLKNQGILCFLVPNKWMDVKYGEKLKSFLTSEYKLLALIGFARNSFAHAQVSTMILLAQKETNSVQRNAHYIKFIQVQDPQGHHRLRSAVYSPISPKIKEVVESQGYDFQNDDPSFHITIVKQGSISPIEKWSYTYMYQSKFARKLNEAPLISLDSKVITTVVGGIKTGANAFFFLSQKELFDFPIEPQFLRPGIRSGRTIPKSLVITSSAEQFLAVPADTNLRNYPQLAAYIANGHEVHQYPQRPSLHWKPWYSIPPEKQDSPDILFLRHIDRNFRARWNLKKCIVADGVRGITVQNPDHLLFYLGVCNSLYFYWQAHIYGRWEGQGDLQLLVYELRHFRIPDINVIPAKKRKRVEQSMQALLDLDIKDSAVIDADNHTRKSLQHTLDLAVLDTLNLSEFLNVLQEETHSLETLRLSKKFQD